jgi:large subunit ribosomal protein L30
MSGSEGQLRITQVRSLIGRNPAQRRTVRALGLRRIRHTVVQPDRPEIRGMVRKVAHLIEVEEVDGGAGSGAGGSDPTSSQQETQSEGSAT